TIGTVIGATLGLLSGYFGGKTDAALRVLIDVFLAVPSLLFLILIASVLRGLGVASIAVIIGAFAWAWPARAVRSQVLSLKERPFVQVGLLSGLSGIEIVWSELMPHLLPWLGANFINAFIAAILTESGLSILGLGSQRDTTLGTMIYWALSYGALLQNMWWWWFLPVLALIVLFLSLYLVHLGLDEVANPRLRTQV
ncbi:MAG TPA: ABC transporter permease, partial [Chloroflexota bacterium]|nr:ABC transporter permease [Chloroflexota bacterium]